MLISFTTCAAFNDIPGQLQILLKGFVRVENVFLKNWFFYLLYSVLSSKTYSKKMYPKNRLCSERKLLLDTSSAKRFLNSGRFA